MKSNLSLLLGIICVLSCTVRNEFVPFYQEENSIRYVLSKQLEAGSLLKFPLRSTSNFYTNSIQLSNIGDRDFLTILDASNNKILVFDYQTQKALNEIKIDSEGPNGVGELHIDSYHYFHNLDSIFLYNLNTGILNLLNARSEILQKIPLTDFKDPKFPVPYPKTSSPIYFFENKVLIPCGLNDYQIDMENYPSVMLIDLDSHKKQYLKTFPKPYGKAFWGTFFKYEPSITINSTSKSLVVNYPIDPYLHVINLSDVNNHGMFFIGSEFFTTIPPYQNDPKYFLKRDPRTTDERESDYAFSTSEYHSIDYDVRRKLYYRKTLVRPSLEDLKNGLRTTDFSIIILDENFNKLGEKLFSGKIYDPFKVFYSSQGIHIFRKDLYQENEDEIVFEVFVPVSVTK